MYPDKWCRKHVLCSSGNLDILQSQMNMSANTVGQLSGYLKRRFKKQVGVTSQAAGTVYVQLSGQGFPLLWLLSLGMRLSEALGSIEAAHAGFH